MLSQRRKLYLTSGFSLFLQIFTIVYGFVLPRLFLEFYGSAVNGLVSSITQFLGFIALAECGVGAVVQSALYKPLAQKDSASLSRIVVSAEHFFRNIAKLLLVYTAILLVIFPHIISGNFDFLYTAILFRNYIPVASLSRSVWFCSDNHPNCSLFVESYHMYSFDEIRLFCAYRQVSLIYCFPASAIGSLIYCPQMV